jgi:mRNA-degrading endonuclease RelE of RelBE toxin-antitoxin system
VNDALVLLAQDPTASANLRSLVGRPETRLRVGEWRVLLTLDTDAQTIVVLRVPPRGRAYRH